MEPLKPESKKRALSLNPDARQTDLDEYQRLLSDRFRTDPSIPKAPSAAAIEEQRESRLAQLYKLLFVAKANRTR